MGILVLFPILEEILLAFHHFSLWACYIWYLLCGIYIPFILSYGLVICGLYYEVYISFTQFVENFCQQTEWVLNFVKCFFWIYLNDHMIFMLHFVSLIYYIDWFVDVESSLLPWNESHLIIVYDHFNVFSICSYVCQTKIIYFF